MNQKYFSDNATGIVVIHIRFWIDRFRHSSLDYHLHLITFYDNDNKYTGVYCLDTRDVCIKESANDSKSIKMAIEYLSKDIAIMFIDRAKSIIIHNQDNQDTKELTKLLFDRAENELWDKFNDLKQSTYIKSMQKIFSSKLINDVKPIDSSPIQDKPDFTHDNAEIRVSEERLILNEAN